MRSSFRATIVRTRDRFARAPNAQVRVREFHAHLARLRAAPRGAQI